MILNLDLQKPVNEAFWLTIRPLVLACGCFDVLTAGHVRHLKAAKQLGASLFVLVTSDRYVRKGEGRPVFPQDLRAEVVDALGCVDFTIINPCPTAVEAIRILRPQVYVKGRDHRDMKTPTVALVDETWALLEVGGRLEFTDTEELHTTDVIQKLNQSPFKDYEHYKEVYASQLNG